MAEAGNEETPVTGRKEEEVVRLSNTLRGAAAIAKSELVRNVLLFVISIYFVHKYLGSEIQPDVFLLQTIWLPLLAFNVVMTVCTAYYVFALTQSSVRFLYIEVFYVNVFRKLVVIFFCVYLLVIIFSPHHWMVSAQHEVIQFKSAYLIFTAAILSYALFDSALVITYICSLYFRMEKLKSFLSKYWFVRLIIMIGIDVLLVCYYIHCLIVHPFNFIFLIYMLMVLGKALIMVWYLKREICAPMSWKMRTLDDQKVPDSQKVKQAVRIMAMKAEVKEVADGAGAA